MNNAEKTRLSGWQTIAIVAAILVPMVDAGDRLWGTASSSVLTSFQVTQLTQTIQATNTRLDALADKLEAMPKQAAVDNLGRRVDGLEQHVNDLTTQFGRLDEQVKVIVRGLPVRGIH